MRTEVKLRERRTAASSSSKFKNSALIPQSSALCLTFCAVLFALCPSVAAQEAGKVPRIGFLSTGSSSSDSIRIEAFRQGLRDLGYVQGKNIAIEHRYAEKNFDQLAAELVRVKVDVIVTGGTPAARAAKNATMTIPIVMAAVGDPVGTGLVASLARPGRNITGLSLLSPELSGKRLELLKETLPRVTRVAVLLNPTNPATEAQLAGTQLTAGSLGVQLQLLEVSSPDQLDRAFSVMMRERVSALVVLTDAMFFDNRTRIMSFAAKSRMPVTCYDSAFVDAGGLMSYGASIPDLYRRAAIYVDKILKGAKPGDLPIEQPRKFELIVNLKTAQQIGVTIPQSVLYRADKVIK
jgi:putative tryptophan/tyrosine transport system substrate-binding protein